MPPLRVEKDGLEKMEFRRMEPLTGDLFSGEQAIERGAANAELARGTELVIAVQFQDELDVAMNGC